MGCDDVNLKILLSDEDETRAFRAASRHVESCARCRTRLLELSTGEFPLDQALESLRAIGEPLLPEPSDSIAGVSVIEDPACLSNDAHAETALPLDFLEPASHPEMLGRIGRYEVERTIGSGGMGVVLKAYDTDLHRVVAIKVLAPHLAHSAAARKRFAREAKAVAAIVHDHVIPIYDVESDGALPYLVMQYVPGQSLQARVDERGPLDAKDVLRIALQIASGLAAAHAQGVIHRDVKPANILLEDSVDRVVISDFGLARTVDDATLTHTGIVAGTPHYMSPEQAIGGNVDPQFTPHFFLLLRRALW